LNLRSLWDAGRQRLSTYEPVAVVTLFIASAGALLFLRITSEMLEGETFGFDEAILRGLRTPQDLGTPIGPAWVTKAFTDITSLGGVTVLSLLTVFTVVYLLLVRKRVTALLVVISIAGGWLISSMLKLGVARPRPDLVPHLVEVNDLSFPSGHAMLSAVTYLTLGLLLAQTQSSKAARYYFVIVAVFLTLLIGISRLFLGVHFPTDVLGGWCAGSAWACLCWLAGRRLIPQSERSEITLRHSPEA
jgi:undecaprenyl-diphosphatase